MPSERYKTLVIVPTTNLPLATDEATAVINLLRAQVLQGSVTIDDVLTMLERGEWDIIWFATHGDENGILLSNGVISASQLTTLVRTSGAWLIVFNTCSSLKVALALHNELLTDLLCTIRQVPDIEAYLTAKQFAIQLSRGLSPHEAYLAAKPGQNEDYLYLVGKRREVIPPSIINKRSNPTLEDVWDELQRLVILIDGDPRWGPGLRETLKNLTNNLEALVIKIDQRFGRIEMTLRTIVTIVIILAIVSAFLIIMMGGQIYSR